MEEYRTAKPSSVWSYDERHEARPRELWVVETQEQLAQRLRELAASPARRTVSLRATGYSLDEAAQGGEVLLQLRKGAQSGALAAVRVEARPQGGWQVCAGALATWGEVLCETRKLGLVVPAMPTGSEITVGGSVSTDSVSRFTPAWGKQFEHLLSVRVMLVSGEVRSARPKREGGTVEEDTLFRAVVAGYGMVAIVLEATFRLRRIAALGEDGALPPLRARTVRRKLPGDVFSWQPSVDAVLRRGRTAHAAREALGEDSFEKPLPSTLWDAPTLVGFFALGEPASTLRSIVYESRLEAGASGLPCPIYGDPKDELRIATVLALADNATAETFEALYWGTVVPGDTFRDRVDWFTFFMDVEVAARARARSQGNRLLSFQQTFQLPPDKAVELLEYLQLLTGFEDVVPSVFDLLYVPPAKDPPMLCASGKEEALAVTVAYQRRERSSQDAGAISALLQQLTDHCSQLGGRVSLTKDVEALPATVRGSYGLEWTEFAKAKSEFDPHHRLENALFHRLTRGTEEQSARDETESP